MTADPREVARLRVIANWLPSTADPLEPDPATPLVAGIESDAGSCTTESSAPDSFTGSCAVGRLEPEQAASLRLIVTSTFNIQVALGISSTTAP